MNQFEELDRQANTLIVLNTNGKVRIARECAVKQVLVSRNGFYHPWDSQLLDKKGEDDESTIANKLSRIAVDEKQVLRHLKSDLLRAVKRAQTGFV